jgi:hypothetical protein
MKYGHIRGASGRRNLGVALMVPSSNSLQTMSKTSRLTARTDREQVQPEIVWVRTRINLVIL